MRIESMRGGGGRNCYKNSTSAAEAKLENSSAPPSLPPASPVALPPLRWRNQQQQKKESGEND